MAEVMRIPPEEARQKVEKGEAILVCAYENEERCRNLHLEGSIHMQELAEKLPGMDKETELIFYCT